MSKLLLLSLLLLLLRFGAVKWVPSAAFSYGKQSFAVHHNQHVQVRTVLLYCTCTCIVHWITQLTWRANYLSHHRSNLPRGNLVWNFIHLHAAKGKLQSSHPNDKRKIIIFLVHGLGVSDCIHADSAPRCA